ncbi:MAG: M48 family metallopeptidase [Candidatus Methylomirabilales bacterium]
MFSIRARILTAIILVTACSARPEGPGLGALVSQEDERAHVAELERKAKQFRGDQEQRLKRVLSRLLRAMPDPHRLTVLILESDSINAYVGGGIIAVSLGMIRFVKSDDELAVVLGHELGHLPSFSGHALLSGIRSDREREADIRGLVYAYRGGYDIRSGAAVFERMAIELVPGPGGRYHGHPSHAERLILAEKVADILDQSGGELNAEILVERLHHLVGSFGDIP